MPDIVSRETRSRMMSGIRGTNTQPELRVRRFLHSHGFRYRLHDRTLPGHPDIVLPRYRTVVFVHGCFWHQHSGCRFATRPDTNADFWRAKLAGNVARDQRQREGLMRRGWRVEVVWECEDVQRWELLARDLQEPQRVAPARAASRRRC